MVRVLAAGLLIGMLPLACGGSSMSVPVHGATGDPEHDLDLGSVNVYAGVLRELPIRRRLNLDVLLGPARVFEEIKQSRRGRDA